MLEHEARLLCEKALQAYYNDDKDFFKRRKRDILSTEAHKHLTINDINLGVVLFTIFTSLPGGSVGTINLYHLLQQYD